MGLAVKFQTMFQRSGQGERKAARAASFESESIPANQSGKAGREETGGLKGFDLYYNAQQDVLKKMGNDPDLLTMKLLNQNQAMLQSHQESQRASPSGRLDVGRLAGLFPSDMGKGHEREGMSF